MHLKSAFASAFTLALGLILILTLPMQARAEQVRVVGSTFGKVFERTPDGEFVGLGVDLVRAIAARTGDTVIFEIYPWPRAQMLVEHGIADVLLGPYQTPERQARFVFSERAFYRDNMRFYMRTDHHSVWDGDYTRLKGLRVGAISGWSYGAVFDRARGTLGIRDIQQLENAIEMLRLGRIDILASNERNTDSLPDALKHKAGANAIIPVAPIIDINDGYLAFPKETRFDPVRARFNSALNSLIDEGALAKLALKHHVAIP
jgi:polar amino acid transport system substrate-binding protein